jgi:hypothetical protein
MEDKSGPPRSGSSVSCTAGKKIGPPRENPPPSVIEVAPSVDVETTAHGNRSIKGKV